MLIAAAVFAVLVCAVVAPCARAGEAAEVPAPEDEQAPAPEKDYAPYPAPDAGYVTDLAELLTPAQEERIEQWLYQTEEKKGVEIAVVTINAIGDWPGTDNASIERFARGLFDKYGIGNMPDNNGVLLLIARRDRKARIELGAGYGRTRDGDARRIMDDVIIPRFRKDRYADGIRKGVEAIIAEFAGLRVRFRWEIVALPILIFIGILVAISLFRSGKRGWGWVVVGLIFVLVLALLRVLFAMLRASSRGSSGGWSSGGFGGGFGGGFSGGGGATGSW
jgi:uncharacterized protein